METKNEKMVKVSHICVDCKRNDSVDINCGGPYILGFDFYVEYDNRKEIHKFVVKKVKEKHPYIRSYADDEEDWIPVKDLWDKEMIEKCINETTF